MNGGPHHVPGTSPYPWPWCGQLSSRRVAMVIVTAPDRPETADGRQTLVTIGAAARAVRSFGVHIVEVQAGPPVSRRTRAVHRPDDDASGRWQADTVVRPLGWDGFFSTPLDSVLRGLGRDQLLLAGWWLEAGVHSTMRSANDRGYECLLMTDLSVPASTLTERGALSSVEMSGGIFGALGTGEAALAALAGLAVSRSTDLLSTSVPTEEFIS